MRFRTLVFAAVAALLLAAPTVASADCACCDDKVCTMACCNKDADKDAAAVLMPPHVQHSKAVRQEAVVWFMRPALVGDRILQGKYIIQHDNDRMARGLPCTHLYAANDRRRPVVEFYCKHLERPAVERATVTTVSTGDPTGLVKFTAFQFAGETAAHGVPTIR